MTTPDLSVVVPSVNGPPILFECLDALLRESASGARLEVIVVDRLGPAVRSAVAARFPAAVVVPADAGATIPEMRALAFDRATGDAVAVIEDHVIVPDGWARQMLESLLSGHDVVGGSVENAATGTTTDWAAFLCEYSHLLPPIPGGEVDALTGNNVVYRRSLLERYRATIAKGRWEDYLHAAMRRDGVRLVCHPEIVVGHKMHYRVRDYVGQRYLYARAYAGLRVAGAGAARRFAMTLGALVLPPVLFVRIVRRVAAKPAYRPTLVRSLPLLVLFVTAWAAGEIVGYSAGSGNALARVT
ncbi:MAG TPA: glycosyltransferase [Vicinamibacterales bacterium]|nr:glycosyltransferase [Vicinamibacterales bacterium]